jgi:hypothetical protein
VTRQIQAEVPGNSIPENARVHGNGSITEYQLDILERRTAMKKIIVSLVVAGFLAVPMVAEAACYQYGQVVRLDVGAGFMNIFLKTSTLAPYTYRFYTTSTQFMDAARTAKVTGEKTYISGNATACPSVSSTAYSIPYGGIVTSMILNP